MRRSDEPNCPPWCVADHDLEDEGTRRHRSATTVVPAVGLASDLAGAQTLELLLEVWSVESSAPWIYLGDGVDQGLEISVESAARLHGALGALLARNGLAAQAIVVPNAKPSA